MMRSASEQQQEDQQSRVYYELSNLVLNLLRAPPATTSFGDEERTEGGGARRRRRRNYDLSQITPGGFAALMLGISMSLMLCGWVTFFIGFILMPWVIGLVMIFYVAGVVSSISMFGRSLLCYAFPPSPPPSSKDLANNDHNNHIPSWKLL